MIAAKNVTGVLCFLSAVCLTLFGSPAHAGIAGLAQFVNGQVQITNAAGQTQALQKNVPVYESNTVTTAKGGSAQIKMRDGGLIALRPNSSLKFDSFVFTGVEDGSERSLLSLIQGGFRAVTGLIGHKNKANYVIAAAGMTIGVRGTDHETFLVVPGSELATRVPAGLYNKVNVGETTLTTDKGTISILPNQMGYAAAADQMPQLLPVNLILFTAVPPPALPAAGGAGDVIGRASTVVDNTVQEQNVAPDGTMPGNPTLHPITADRGPTAPPIKF